jgi:hypothetical protein
MQHLSDFYREHNSGFSRNDFNQSHEEYVLPMHALPLFYRQFCLDVIFDQVVRVNMGLAPLPWI